MESENNILELRNIVKRYPGVLALDAVSMNVKAGAVHGLVGENGAGNPPLLRCLLVPIAQTLERSSLMDNPFPPLPLIRR